MARLLLIRHGEPEAAWGEGQDDPGLSAVGRRQALAAAAALVGKGRLDVLTSPMRRCQETAAPYLARLNLPQARLHPRFGEVETPPGVADRRAWLMENFPWRAAAAPRGWLSVALELRNWRDHVLNAARAIAQDTAVFTHFIASNVIVGAAMESPQTIVFRPDYASITELEVSDGQIMLRRLGEEMREGEVR